MGHPARILPLLLCVLVAIGVRDPPFARGTSTAQEWTPWERMHGLPDGQGGGIDVSFRHGRFTYGGGGHRIAYRFRNRYSQPVVMEAELLLDREAAPRISVLSKMRSLAVDETPGMDAIARSVRSVRMLRFGFGTEYSALRPAGSSGGNTGSGASSPRDPRRTVDQTEYDQRDAQGQRVNRVIWLEGDRHYCSQTPAGRSGPEAACTFSPGEQRRRPRYEFKPTLR